MRAWLASYLLLSIPACFRAEAHLSKEIEDSKRRYQKECRELGQFVPNLEDDVIQRHQDSDAKRLKSIEDKAKANLLGITIGVAVLFSGFNMVAGEGSASLVTGWFRVLSLILLAVAVCYLLAGGLMALKALRLRPLFSPSLREEAAASQHMCTVQAVWALKQNERTALMGTNALSVSFDGIRNGIISLAVAVVLLAASIAFSDPDSLTRRSVDDLTRGTSMDSAHPSASDSNRTEAAKDLRVGPPAVVDDSAGSPEAVDTLP